MQSQNSENQKNTSYIKKEMYTHCVQNFSMMTCASTLDRFSNRKRSKAYQGLCAKIRTTDAIELMFAQMLSLKSLM